MSRRLRMARTIWYRRRGVVADRSVVEDLFAYCSHAGFWRVLQLFEERISPAFDRSLMICTSWYLIWQTASFEWSVVAV
jgi:hypothetical protein